MRYSNYNFMMNGKNYCGTSNGGRWLVVVGAINWGLIGLGGFFGSDWNLVNKIFGSWPTVEWIVYILVGVAGVMMAVGCKCKTCKVQ